MSLSSVASFLIEFLLNFLPFLKTFPNKILLANHNRRVHKKDETYKCTTCDKKFKCKDYLRIHNIRVHEKRTLISCNHCGKEFSNTENMTRHIKVVHEKREDVIQNLKTDHTIQNFNPHKHVTITDYCPFCDIRFASSSSVRNHIRIIHKRMEKIKCEFCERSYITENEVREHILSFHKKLKEHQCEFCTK